ncbi:MAG: ATP-grasp domain-containing protein [FCB group bacterium]|nr:ATP-grasp domain-containing protein [FCB group bacterium]
MKKPINILVFPAGEVNAIELHNALSTCVNVTVAGASSIDRHGGYVFRDYISGLAHIDSPGFFEALNNLVRERSIDIIFPTHDTVAVFLATNRERIKTRVMAPDVETTSICRNKAHTYALFKDCSFCPKVYEVPDQIRTMPVFVKPKMGQGSVGAGICRTLEEVQTVEFNANVVTEFLPGDEITVDCLTDHKGVLKLASPRSRDRVMAGVSVAGRTEPLTPEIEQIAITINSRLRFLGLWFFQLRKDNQGRYKLLEVSARCAGTMCLTRARGANLPLLSVYTALGQDIDILTNPYTVTVDRTLINRYRIDYEYDTVYFDFDDTIIINSEVNLNAIRFLYQCRNSHKKVVLLTRHERDFAQSMERFSIHKSLFADIVLLNEEACKSDYINPGRAIFIDNSFKERKAVADAHGIPVFDVDAIEVLLDWRL